MSKSFFLQTALLIFSIIFTRYFNLFSPTPYNHSKNTNTTTIAPHTNTRVDGEMKAVWIPFMTLDLKGTDYSQSAFAEKFNHIIASATSAKLNTLIVQVRPHADALYPSAYFPWSHLLTGTQGEYPGYDPLAYMIEKTHEAGLKFHAWINPLRIMSNNTPPALCASHDYFALQDDADKIIKSGTGIYYNPSFPDNRQKIINGVKEIVQNYSVDGIQFDDYFYPDGDTYDASSYNDYYNQASSSGTPLTLIEWREANIDSLISGVYNAIKGICSEIQFGISPQGNIANNLKTGANVYKWGAHEGYVDYLAPQMYVNFEHPSLPFDEMSRQWDDVIKCPNINLYYGIGVYKAGSNADQGTWKKSNDILKKEIEYSRTKNIKGFMLYSFDYLNTPDTAEEVTNMLAIL